jgi:hypothetical protein
MGGRRSPASHLPMTLRHSRTILAAGIGLFLAGCGGSDKAATSAAVPPCAKVGRTVSLPQDFPDELPIPAGTAFTVSEPLDSGTIRVGGVVPQPFSEVVAFFQKELPASGFALGEGDAEQDEAEAAFSGHGYEGKWKINGILNCPNAVTLALVLIHQT